MPGNAENAGSVFFVIGLPLTALAVGLVLWLTRKRT
jgi:LPXTG-motif cell wall-anchored protein